jgi:transposase-like protein
VSASASVTVPAAAARDGSIEARRAARVEKFKRERLVIDYLNRGVSVREIAVKLGVTEKRMRAIVKEALAAHLPGPPEEFVALQISRLNEALLVAYSAMSGMNLKAVDRVVRIAHELDRYQGFFPAERRCDGREVEAKAEEPRRLLTRRPEMAPQAPEKAQSAPGDATASVCRPLGSGDPEWPSASAPGDDSAFCSLADPAKTLSAPDATLTARPEMAPQAIESAQSAPENNTAASSSDEASGLALEASSATSEWRRPAAQGARDGRPPIRPEMAPQALEKAQPAPEHDMVPDASGECFRSSPGQDAHAHGALAYEPLSTAPIEISPQNAASAQSPAPMRVLP